MHRVWKQIDSIEFDSFVECATEYSRIYKLSPWIIDIIQRNHYEFKNYDLPIRLVEKKVSDFGFESPTELIKIYDEINLAGFELVPPEIAIFSRKLYLEQPTGEWLRFATPLDAMIDSDGVPHLPKLGKALGCYFIETYWSYKHAVFHPHNEFVMVSS